MNAVIYARYSSSNQKETSIDDQLRVCQEYADNNDINIIGKYLDYEQTGTSDNREQFQRMLRDSSRCIFDAILVYEFTRFARNRYDSVIYKHRLKSYNIHVVSVTEYILTIAENLLLMVKEVIHPKKMMMTSFVLRVGCPLLSIVIHGRRYKHGWRKISVPRLGQKLR